MVFQIILDVLLAILVVGVIVIIIADTGDSGRKIAWLLVITLLPVVGAVLYLCFGYNWRNHGVFYDRETALQCRAIFEKELEVSREITLDTVREWAWYRKIWQKVIRLFSPLL